MDPELLTLIQARHIGESIMAQKFEGSFLFNLLRVDKKSIHLKLDDALVVDGGGLRHGQVKWEFFTKGSGHKGVIVSLLDDVVDTSDFLVDNARDLAELTIDGLLDERVGPSGNGVDNTRSEFELKVIKGND